MVSLVLSMNVKKHTSVNIYVLFLRFIQFFFAGMIIGVCAYYIKVCRKYHQSIPMGVNFALVIGVIAIVTLFAYLFVNIRKMHSLFFWDIAMFVFWLLSFFWLKDKLHPVMKCSWKHANPFTGNNCQQFQAVLVFEIVCCALWGLTAISGFLMFRSAQKEAVVVTK